MDSIAKHTAFDQEIKTCSALTVRRFHDTRGSANRNEWSQQGLSEFRILLRPASQHLPAHGLYPKGPHGKSHPPSLIRPVGVFTKAARPVEALPRQFGVLAPQGQRAGKRATLCSCSSANSKNGCSFPVEGSLQHLIPLKPLGRRPSPARVQRIENELCSYAETPTKASMPSK